MKGDVFMNPYKYCLALSILFLGGTLYFIKKRVLDFKYSIFWISTSLLMIILSLNKDFTEGMAEAVSIAYAPAFLFVTGIVFIFFLLFYLSLVISKMQNKITLLIQEIGILKSCVDEGEYKDDIHFVSNKHNTSCYRANPVENRIKGN